MATEIQVSIVQRPLRGSRISTFYPVKSLPTLSSLDSAFQLQEYISLLIRLDVHDVEAITTLPGSNKDVKDKEGSVGVEKGEQEGKEGVVSEGEKGSEERDVNVDEACWIYEQLRRLAQDLTHPLITTLQQECSRTTCPEMKAGEWLYLCVAHGTEGAMEQCCAIDYILHTLDSATALLNSPRAFPSRLQIPPSSHRHFSSLARRLGRIFAHAYFHHREAFEQAEAESSLYARFLSLTSKFDLVPVEFLFIPASASAGIGGDSDEEDGGESGRGGGGGGGISGGGGGGSGFGLREVKLGTSYDPRRSSGGVQHQLPSSFQDEFPDVPRTRRLPQQYQHLHLLHPSQQHGTQHQQKSSMSLEPSPMGGAESPRKTGRNRTHTMVLSETTIVVDELAKAAAAASAKAEEEEKERKEKEAKAREEVEREQREKDEVEAQVKHEAEELISGEGEQKDVDEDAVEKDLTIEEKAGEGEEGVGEGTDDVSSEEESAVEALLAAPDQEPTKEETKSSEPEEPAATPTTKAEGEESGTQEVDIVEGATTPAAETTETTETPEVEGVEHDEAVTEAKEEVEEDVTSPEVEEDLTQVDTEGPEEVEGAEKEAS